MRSLLVILFCLVMAVPGWAGDSRILTIPYSQAEKLLEDLEAGKLDKQRLDACDDTLKRGVILFEECKAAKESIDKRAQELVVERDEALKMAKDATDTGKKIAVVPWYKRAWDAGKWILVGILIGFGASR